MKLLKEPTLKEPNAYMPQEDEKPGCLTRPVRVTMESRLPGSKHTVKTVTECESAIVLSEKVTGAVRSADNPSEFLEKREGSIELAGFKYPGDAVSFLVSSTVAAVHQMSGEDDKRFRTNFLTATQILLDKSGISREDLTLQVSDEMLAHREEVIARDQQAKAEADLQARTKGKGKAKAGKR